MQTKRSLRTRLSDHSLDPPSLLVAHNSFFLLTCLELSADKLLPFPVCSQAKAASQYARKESESLDDSITKGGSESD